MTRYFRHNIFNTEGELINNIERELTPDEAMAEIIDELASLDVKLPRYAEDIAPVGSLHPKLEEIRDQKIALRLEYAAYLALKNQ